MATVIRHLSYKVHSLNDEFSFFEIFERPTIFHEFINPQGERYGIMFRLRSGMDIELFHSATPTYSADIHFAFGVEGIRELHSLLSPNHQTSDIFRGKTDNILQFHVISPGGFRFEFHEMGTA